MNQTTLHEDIEMLLEHILYCHDKRIECDINSFLFREAIGDPAITENVSLSVNEKSFFGNFQAKIKKGRVRKLRKLHQLMKL